MVDPLENVRIRLFLFQLFSQLPSTSMEGVIQRLNLGSRICSTPLAMSTLMMRSWIGPGPQCLGLGLNGSVFVAR